MALARASPDTLVDSNVLIDIINEDPQWLDWSTSALRKAGRSGALVINPIVYAEISTRFETLEDLEAAIQEFRFRREPLSWEAAFLAGKAFVRYRAQGGAKRSPLPDFYVGAHAALAGLTLLTRDARRYREYFPRLKLISPN